MEACENILHDCEVGEKANILIGAGNSETDDSVRQQANEGMIVKQNLSGFRPVKAGDAIEKGRLASTIGPDDTVDAMFFDLYVQITHGNQPAEAFREFLCRKSSHRIFYLPRQQKAPPGLNERG
jgi:hypothetical protein